jgi:aminopeptidase N
MEQASGKKLGGFFQQWLYRPEIPKIKASWAMDKKGNSVGLTIEQVQSGSPFDFPLEIGLVNDKGILTTEKARINQKTQKLTFSVAGTIQKIVLDPQINLLFEEIIKN